IVAAQALDELSDSWITTAMTLFVVSLVLLVLILRDQRRAIVALETASEREALTTANAPGAAGGAHAPAGPDRHADAPGAQARRAGAGGHGAPGGPRPLGSRGGHLPADLAGLPGSHDRDPLPPAAGLAPPRARAAPSDAHPGARRPNTPARAGTASGYADPS